MITKIFSNFKLSQLIFLMDGFEGLIIVIFWPSRAVLLNNFQGFYGTEIKEGFV